MTEKLNAELESLRGVKLFIATPMFGGMCHGTFTGSMTQLFAICTKYGISIQFNIMPNESLVQRARNYCAHEFLCSDFTYLMFIDSDIGFNPLSVLGMLAMMVADTDHKYDVLAAVYPKKSIDWEKIKLASDKGLGDKNPNDLAKFGLSFTFNPIKEGLFTFSSSNPSEVLEAGTGFMMIPRRTFMNFIKAYPDQSFKPYPKDSYTKSDFFKKIHAFFDPIIDPETEYYLGEDYMFCQYVRKMGGRVWILPWLELSHAGSYLYTSSLLTAASLNKDLEKNKKYERVD